MKKYQSGGDINDYDETESLPIKATFADKMKQQQQYGSPQIQQGDLPTNIENRTRGRNLRGDDIVSTVDEDIANKYAVRPETDKKIVEPTKTFNTTSNDNLPKINTEYSKKAANEGLYMTEKLERDANARFEKGNPIKNYKDVVTKSSEVDYNDEIFGRGKNTKNQYGVEETPIYTTKSNSTTNKTSPKTTYNSNVQLGGDKKGSEVMGSYKGEADSELHAHQDFKKKGWSDESGNLTDAYYNQLGDKTLSEGLRKFGITAKDITSDRKDFGNPAVNNLVSNVRGQYAQKRTNDTSYYTITKDASGLTNFKEYLSKNNPVYQSMSEGERTKYFLPENRNMLEKQFGMDMNNFTKNRTSAKGSVEVKRSGLVTGESESKDVEMNKTKSSNEKTPGYDGTIKTEAGDRYKANVEVPGNKSNTPPNQNVNPNPKPKPNIGTGKLNKTTSGKPKTSTTSTYNPGTNSNTKPKTNTVKSARKNEAEATNSKLGTDTDKNMDVNGKGSTYDRGGLKRFGKQMGGYSDQVNSDYGQYTKSNTSYNPEIKIGSVDYYKQFMKTGGNVSRFKQLDEERAKINKPKYQEGQKIKYKMGGNIKEGVVKSYNQDTGKVELYE